MKALDSNVLQDYLEKNESNDLQGTDSLQYAEDLAYGGSSLKHDASTRWLTQARCLRLLSATVSAK